MFRMTRKDVNRNFNRVFQLGYCELEPLARFFDKVGYNYGVYGWNYHVYKIGSTAVVTGYRSMFGAELPAGAEKILKNAKRYDKKRRENGYKIPYEQAEKYYRTAGHKKQEHIKMRLNSKIFHEFFYSEKRGLDTIDGIQGRASVSYRGNVFRSYNTEIGRIITRGSVKALLISHYSLTPTTCGHIGALIRACPFPYIPVPFDFNDNFSCDKAAIDTMFRRMERWIRENKAKLSRAENRAEMQRYIRSYRQLALFNGLKVPEKLDAVMTAAESVITDAENKLKARRAELEKTKIQRAIERAEKLNQTAENGCSGWNIMEKAKARFTYLFSDDQKDLHFALCELFRAVYPAYSFVWYDDDNRVIRTSQDVTMSPDTAARAYKAFKAGKIQAGMHVGPYYVREITPDFVQIGCHRILMENIEQLAALLNWND